jgi:hypothetical protein
MIPISRYDIEEELDKVKTVEELKILLKKYKYRIETNISFTIDNKSVSTEKEFWINSNFEIEMEKA